MSPIEQILRSALKPKEKQVLLADSVVEGRIPVADLMTFLASAGRSDRGTCADVLKHVSARKPALLVPFLEPLIALIHDDLPRVKWGAQEAIGLLAHDYPGEAARAVPSLLQNTAITEANTTVVRWCAAFALTEIARSDAQSRDQLRPVFERILSTEQNSGVTKVYLKALKATENGRRTG